MRLGLLLGLGATLCSAQPLVDFNRQVHPILVSRCLPCHSEDKRSGGLMLATYDGVFAGGRNGAAIKPGNPEGSLLMRRVTGEVQPQMPFGGDPLAPAQIALIRAWIAQGARATPPSQPARARWEPPLLLDRPMPP